MQMSCVTALALRLRICVAQMALVPYEFGTNREEHIRQGDLILACGSCFGGALLEPVGDSTQ